MTVRGVNLLKYDKLPGTMETVTKIRYRDPGTLSEVVQQSSDVVEVSFMANVRGIAPGQSAVFYEDDDVIGGGIMPPLMATNILPFVLIFRRVAKIRLN